MADTPLLTTPDPVTLHRTLRVMADRGCSVVIMEVSSHALAQHRTTGIPWQVAVFTHLTRDHLDYHGSERAYFESKASLFLPHSVAGVVGREREGVPRAAVIGTEGSWGRALWNRCASFMPVWAFGLAESGGQGPFSAHDLVLSWQGSRFRLMLPDDASVDVVLPSIGRFNVSNALAASAACWQLGCRGEAIVRGLQHFSPPPGRMEPISCGQPFAVVVDYAHTPDALERVLNNARLLTQRGRIITVFGCGGARDRGKRAIMGQLAARLSDYSVITDDNPRTEDPAAIRRAILEGCRQEVGQTVEIADRALAIGHALQQARPNDAVLIVGKGHEAVQIMADGTHPFDDAQVARGFLASLKK